MCKKIDRLSVCFFIQKIGMEKLKMKKCTIGGQGVMDGIMMRSVEKSALAVRKPSGEIDLKIWKNKEHTSIFYKVPIIRGVFSFIEMMVNGVSVLTESAKMVGLDEEEYEPSKMEKAIAKKTGKSAEDIMMFFAVVIALVMAVGLFFVLPTLITNLIKGSIKSSFLINLIDGGIRILIFLGYMLVVSLLPDIKTVFRYHGAEHKTIFCYENDLPLTVENVKPQKRLHPRCGTSYLLLVMVLSTVIYSCFPWGNSMLLRMAIKLLLLPVIAGVSYEVLKLLAKGNHILVRALRWPGMQLQRLTTAEPDEEMIQVAIVAFEAALGEKSPEEIEQMRQAFAAESIMQAQQAEEPEERQDNEEQA